METTLIAKILTQAQITAGDAVALDNVLIKTPTGEIYNSGPSGQAARQVVDASNINTVLQAAGGGYPKVQVSGANIALTYDTHNAKTVHVEAATPPAVSSLSSLVAANWKNGSVFQDSMFYIQNHSGADIVFNVPVGASEFTGLAELGNQDVSAGFTIPDRTEALVKVNSDGWVQVSISSQMVTQAELSQVIATPISAYSAMSMYAIGNLTNYNDVVYRCTTAITVGEVFTPSKWVPITERLFVENTLSSGSFTILSTGIYTIGHAMNFGGSATPIAGNAIRIKVNGVQVNENLHTSTGGASTNNDTLVTKLNTGDVVTFFADPANTAQKIDSGNVFIQNEAGTVEYSKLTKSGTQTLSTGNEELLVFATATTNPTGIKADKSHAHAISDTTGLQTAFDAKVDETVSIAMSTGYPTASIARSFLLAGQILDISQISVASMSGVDINGSYVVDSLTGQFIANTLNTSVAGEITCWFGVLDGTLTKAVKAKFVNASGGINITITEAAYWNSDVLTSASWTTAGGEPASKNAGDIASSNGANGYGLEALTLILDVMKGKADKASIPIAIVVNNTLTSSSTTEALSAAQGKALQDGKQATLVSATNIKTVDGQSLLGAGNIAPTILVVTAPIAIRITGAAGAGTNYPVKVTIGESAGATGANFNLSTAAGIFPSGKNGTCSFLFWDSSGAVPFWVEKVTGTTPNRVSHVWLAPLVSLSSGTPTIFLTTAATNLIRSSGEAVFTLFDDFDGISLDTAKWDTSVMTGDTYASSILSFGGGNVARKLRTLNAIGDGFELMSLLRASDTTASYVAFGWDSGTTAEIYKYENGWNTAARINVAGVTTNLTTDINNGAGVRQLMRIGRASGVGRFSSETPANTVNSASGVPTVALAPTIFNTYDNSCEVDWVAVKRFVATEPAFSSAVQ